MGVVNFRVLRTIGFACENWSQHETTIFNDFSSCKLVEVLPQSINYGTLRIVEIIDRNAQACENWFTTCNYYLHCEIKYYWRFQQTCKKSNLAGLRYDIRIARKISLWEARKHWFPSGQPAKLITAKSMAIWNHSQIKQILFRKMANFSTRRKYNLLRNFHCYGWRWFCDCEYNWGRV